MMIDKQKLLDILTSEIESSTGCTDPGSVCLAVAVAAHTLGRRPEKIDVLVSPNIYKNGVSVGIPGTNRIGLELAAALGALLDEPERGLAILADVTGDIVRQAAAIVSDGRVHVAYGQTPEPLYVRAIVSGGGEEAQAVIRGDYSCVTEILRNGAPVMQAEGRTHGAAVYPLVGYSVQELYETILSMEPESFRFLLEDARRNQEAVRRDLEDPGAAAGQAAEAADFRSDDRPAGSFCRGAGLHRRRRGGPDERPECDHHGHCRKRQPRHYELCGRPLRSGGAGSL